MPHERKTLSQAASGSRHEPPGSARGLTTSSRPRGEQSSRGNAGAGEGAGRFRRGAVLGAMGGLALLAIFFAWRSATGRSEALRPADVTYNRHSELTANIARFAILRQALPEKLDEVVREFGPAGGTLDGWRRPFAYEPGTKGKLRMSFVLRSLGEDGREGTDDDRVSDVVMIDDDDGRASASLVETREGK